MISGNTAKNKNEITVVISEELHKKIEPYLRKRMMSIIVSKLIEEHWTEIEQNYGKLVK